VNKKRYIYFWLKQIFTRLAPVLIISQQYALFEKTTPARIKLAAVGMLIVLWLIIKFGQDFHIWTKRLSEGMLKSFLFSVSRLLPYIIMVLITWIAYESIDKLMYVSIGLLVTNIVGVYFSTMHEYHVKQDLINRGFVNVLQ